MEERIDMEKPRERKESIQRNSPEISAESIETLSTLKNYIDQGYLLHGSKSNAAELEPRQASDNDAERITGHQLGVYGIDSVEAPIFMALRDKANTFKGSRSFYHGTDGKYEMGGENVTLTPGYIHVIPRDTFELVSDEKGDEELVSRVPVRAVAVVEIQPDIIQLLPNVTLNLSSD
jgi:hypothetical protein